MKRKRETNKMRFYGRRLRIHWVDHLRDGKWKEKALYSQNRNGKMLKFWANNGDKALENLLLSDILRSGGTEEDRTSHT